MLVGVREFLRDEVRQVCGLGSDGLATHYTLHVSKNEAIVVDATDTRARRVVNIDYYASSSRDLFANAVAPLLHALLPPAAAPQVVFVVDGTDWTRRHALLDPDEGLLVACWRHLRTSSAFAPVIAVIYAAVVELDDDNRLRDLSLSAGDDDPAREPTIMEDADDHFTAVEDAKYAELRVLDDVHALLHRTDANASGARHHVVSFIIAYRAESGLPNATVQFVSLAVAELARGMRSTRHCVTTAASLLESRSPSTEFGGTRLSFLLKPALLGRQPALWVACFAPASPAEARRRETFKEAFCVAYTASRVHSSRIGVGFCRAAAAPTLAERRPLFRSPKRHADDIASPTPADHDAGTAYIDWGTRENMEEDALPNPRADVPHPTPTGRSTALVATPSGRRTDFGSRRARSSSRRGESPVSRDGRAPFDACSSLEPHPVRCSARYEFETYRRVMEPAMEQLRGDLRTTAVRLDEARRALRAARRARDEAVGAQHAHAAEVSALRAELDAREALIRTLRERAAQLEAAAERQKTASPPPGVSSQVAAPAAQLAQLERSPSDSPAEAPSSSAVPWLRVVDFHQRELASQAERDRAYRDRVVRLEALLAERDVALAAARTELARAERDRVLEAARAEQSVRERDAQHAAAVAEERLESAQREAAEERKRREVAEEELRRAARRASVLSPAEEVPKMRPQMVADSGHSVAPRFEEFMRRESSYTLRPPPSLERGRP